jgi:hypothetical protein
MITERNNSKLTEIQSMLETIKLTKKDLIKKPLPEAISPSFAAQRQRFQQTFAELRQK